MNKQYWGILLLFFGLNVCAAEKPQKAPLYWQLVAAASSAKNAAITAVIHDETPRSDRTQQRVDNVRVSSDSGYINKALGDFAKFNSQFFKPETIGLIHRWGDAEIAVITHDLTSEQ
jgi:hypothetical protein